jgi:hypothetical protein
MTVSWHRSTSEDGPQKRGKRLLLFYTSAEKPRFYVSILSRSTDKVVGSRVRLSLESPTRSGEVNLFWLPDEATFPTS